MVRRQGDATKGSDFIVSLVGPAVPVGREDERVLAMLTISAPKIRMKVEKLTPVTPAMRSAAARIARAI